jgi:hypothetical protein
MKSHREWLIDELINQVEGWDLDTLIDFVKNTLFDRYSKWKTSELEEEYVSMFGKEDYPETFPDGYHEP